MGENANRRGSAPVVRFGAAPDDAPTPPLQDLPLAGERPPAEELALGDGELAFTPELDQVMGFYSSATQVRAMALIGVGRAKTSVVNHVALAASANRTTFLMNYPG